MLVYISLSLYIYEHNIITANMLYVWHIPVKYFVINLTHNTVDNEFYGIIWFK